MDSAPRRRPGPRARAAAVAVVLLTLLSGTLRADAGRAGAPGDDLVLDLAVSPVDVRGEATGLLWPGRRTPLRIEVRNLTGSTIRVRQVRVRIAGIRAPRATTRRPCTRADFWVRQLARQRTVWIGPRGTAVVRGTAAGGRPSISIVHRSSNQDGCKGAQVRLVFTVGDVHRQRRPR